MIKKLLTLLILSSISFPIFADQCPSINDIKHNQFNHWKAYDSEDGKPLSKERFAMFQKNAEEFVLAEWKNAHQEGAIHCYYHDRNGSDLETYLSKEHFALDNPNKYWYQVTGAMNCAAGKSVCNFHLNSPIKQFANR